MHSGGPIPKRSRDDGRTLRAFIGEIDVVCPRCDGRAAVRMIEACGDSALVTLPARLTCSQCGISRTQKLDRNVIYSYHLRSDGCDPFFRLPLLLAAPTRHGLVFAYNAAHLAALEDFVGASLRERHTLRSTMLRNATMQSRLPRWMKLAANRCDVLNALQRLRDRLDAGT